MSPSSDLTPERSGLDRHSSSTIDVAYIAGWGRSGSTLLARMLGELPGVVSVGEIRDLWQRGVVEDRLCGCGEPFSECPFWSNVGQLAFGGWGNVDAQRMLHLRGALDRPWQFGKLLHNRGSRRFNAELDEYVGQLEKLYRAMALAGDGKVIVDSSKIPSFALILERMTSARVRAVHLVRDSRGVVHSWQKKVLLPDKPGGRDYMIRYPVAPAALRYAGYNVQAERMGRSRVGTIRVRYEDLVAEPEQYFRIICAHFGLEVPQALPFLQRDKVTLGSTHTVVGNPMRMARDALALRVDDAWMTAMPPRSRRLVTLLTAPVLARYGYKKRG